MCIIFGRIQRVGECMAVFESAISAASGLAGVMLGAWLLCLQERRRYRRDLIERRIKDFYSPMFGIRTEIKVRSEMRNAIQGAAEIAWQKLYEETTVHGPAALQDLTKNKSNKFSKLIQYDNDKFQQDSLPAYRRMVSLFRDSMWLADVDTRRHYRDLVEYLEVWERFQVGALPAEVLPLLGHSESNLHPFYLHIETRLEELRTQLYGGKIGW